MNNEYNYHSYLQTRIKNIENIIKNNLSFLTDKEQTETILFDTIYEYEEILNEEIIKLYESANIYPMSDNLELYLYKIENQELRNQISNYFFELNILNNAISNLTNPQKDEEVNDQEVFEAIINKIPHESRTEILETVNHYENLYQEKIKYLGRGETCTVFSIGNKIIKFGAIRRYPEIPLCLNIELAKQYDKYSYMYVTERLETNNISQEDTKNVYYTLRDKGYVWVDVKPDNLGKQNGELKIIDDIDIYTEKDIRLEGKSNVLEFVSYNLDLALLELSYLSSRNKDFDINQIDAYFSNESSSTKEFILKLKEEYLKHQRTYYYIPNDNEFPLFIEILLNKIKEYEVPNQTRHK